MTAKGKKKTSQKKKKPKPEPEASRPVEPDTEADIASLYSDKVETKPMPVSIINELQKAELTTAMELARQNPRSLKEFYTKAITLATTDIEVAKSCMYSLPRAGGTIRGKSIRLAEIIAVSYRNIWYAARPIETDEQCIRCRGVCIDLETNTHASLEVSRRITDKYGRRYSDDMIIMTANAGNSIAMRNTIFKIVPEALVNPIYERVKKTIAGEYASLGAKTKTLLEEIEAYGIGIDRVLAVLGRQSHAEIDVEDIITLVGLVNAIKEKEFTAVEAFPPIETEGKSRLDAMMEKRRREKEAKAQQQPVETPRAPEDATEDEAPSTETKPEPESLLTGDERTDVIDYRAEHDITDKTMSLILTDLGYDKLHFVKQSDKDKLWAKLKELVLGRA